MKNETSRGWFSLATESVIIRVGRQDLLKIKRPKSEADYRYQLTPKVTRSSEDKTGVVRTRKACELAW